MRERQSDGCILGPGPHCLPNGGEPGRGARAGTQRRHAAPHRPPHGDLPGQHPPGHAHGHRHGAGHDRRGVDKKGLKVVLVLTGVFMLAELVGGILANSLALLADAAHMFTDVGALALSLFALWFAQRPATPEKTYGYLRLEILAALLNGATLILLSGFIFYEAYQRLRAPAQVESDIMLVVAAAGLLVNVIAAALLHRSAGQSLNVRGAYLHVLGDLLGSLGAVIAALVIMTTGWTRADPLISILVGILILFSSWKLVRESVEVLLDRKSVV